jgi:hypothetical protein
LKSIESKTIFSNESITQHIKEILSHESIASDDVLLNIIRKMAEELDDTSYEAPLKIVTDMPVDDGVLDFSKYSILLSRIIRTSTPRFSVGIFGGWGTGKTTLATMIKKDLDQVNAQVISWNEILANDVQVKLKSFLRNTYNFPWLDNSKFRQPKPNTLIIEDLHDEKVVDRKGTYENKPKNSLVIEIADGNANIISGNGQTIGELDLWEENGNSMLELKDKKILTVLFDAWRYERDENLVTVALIREILLNVERFIKSRQSAKTNLWIDVKDSLKRSAIAFIRSTKISYGIKDVVSVETDFEKLLDSFRDPNIIGGKDVLYFQATAHLERSLNWLRKFDRTVE